MFFGKISAERLNWKVKLIIGLVGIIGIVVKFIDAKGLEVLPLKVADSIQAAPQNNTQISSNSGVVVGGNANNLEVTQNFISQNQNDICDNKDCVQLINPNGSFALFKDEPGLPGEIKCQPYPNSKAQLLGDTVMAIGQEWKRVKILDGNCEGKIGWTSASNIRQS